jgi:putative endonuclease
VSDRSDQRQAVGREAETAAADYLTRTGFTVLERNVRLGHGELDLVCRDGDVVVFVEVKCRRATWGDPPAAAVSWHKQRRLTRLAQHYLKWRRLDDARCRFDVVSVTIDAAGRTGITHVRGAFDAIE